MKKDHKTAMNFSDKGIGGFDIDHKPALIPSDLTSHVSVVGPSVAACFHVDWSRPETQTARLSEWRVGIWRVQCCE